VCVCVCARARAGARGAPACVWLLLPCSLSISLFKCWLVPVFNLCILYRERESESENEIERECVGDSLCLLGTPHSHARTRLHRAHSFLIKSLSPNVPHTSRRISRRERRDHFRLMTSKASRGAGAGAGFIQSTRIERARWTLSVTWVRH
jgi:hypothetical protein